MFRDDTDQQRIRRCLQWEDFDIKVLRPSGPNYWKTLNGYLMFSVKDIVQNVKVIELWGNNLVPLHFAISKC